MVVAGTIPNDPRLGRQHLLGAVIGGIQFTPGQVVLTPDVRYQPTVHHAITIEMIGYIHVQGIHYVHQWLVRNETIIIIIHCNRSLSLQSLQYTAWLAG